MKIYDYYTDSVVREATSYDVAEYEGYLASDGVPEIQYTMPAYLLPDIPDHVVEVYIS